MAKYLVSVKLSEGSYFDVAVEATSLSDAKHKIEAKGGEIHVGPYPLNEQPVSQKSGFLTGLLITMPLMAILHFMGGAILFSIMLAMVTFVEKLGLH